MGEIRASEGAQIVHRGVVDDQTLETDSVQCNSAMAWQTEPDMHGNRNSAFACWGNTEKSSLLTETTLGDDAVFFAETTKPHYHEEKRPTVHTRPKSS